MRHRPRLVRLVLISALAIVGIDLGLGPQVASAHNSLVSSDPADGAVLAEAPTEVVWTFDKPVPLDTLTVTLVDASGVRSDLSGSRHGPTGEQIVITPLPALEPGPISLRWRLVGADGHPVTSRIDVTIEAPAASTVPTTVAPSVEATDDRTSTPSVVRWILRLAAYAAIVGVVGVVLVSTLVWPDAIRQPRLRPFVSQGLVATAVLGLLQALVVASDISGEPFWRSFDSLDAAMGTDAGMAFMVRVVIAVGMWLVLFGQPIVSEQALRAASLLPAFGLLTTWAFAGHARSQRAAGLGVVADVAHHAAAATWLAGLGVVAWSVVPGRDPGEAARLVSRFSQVALVSVVVLVGTGVIQSARLLGGAAALVDTTHGRLLALKVALVGGMLLLAKGSRRRIADPQWRDEEHPPALGAIRRSVVREFSIGAIVIAMTAAMVTSQPGVALSDSAER